MDHDRLFKELLTTFFAEFIELFLPKMAAALDRESIHFLDKEVFPDFNTGDRHEVDLLAKAKLSGQEAFILIHVENQASAQTDFPKRMFRYFSLLHTKFDLPVFPIALFSYESPLALAANQYKLELSDHPILQFRFHAIQLNRLNWRDFLSQPNPVANALMTRMKIAPGDRPRVKLECLRMLATLRLDMARSEMIGVFMNSYLRLTAAETVVYTQGVEAFGPQEKEFVMRYMTEWEEKGLERGIAQGRMEGRMEGRTEGRMEGRTEGQIELIVKLLNYRFGAVPPILVDAVGHLAAGDLDNLSRALLTFKSLSEAQDWIARLPSAPTSA